MIQPSQQTLTPLSRPAGGSYGQRSCQQAITQTLETTAALIAA
jgi:hypothetical protein